MTASDDKILVTSSAVTEALHGCNPKSQVIRIKLFAYINVEAKYH